MALDKLVELVLVEGKCEGRWGALLDRLAGGTAKMPGLLGFTATAHAVMRLVRRNSWQGSRVLI